LNEGEIMPKKSMTIEEVKKAKIQFEKEILEKIKSFESDTGVRIGYISLDRETDEGVPTPAMEQRGPVINVDASMELDLVY